MRCYLSGALTSAPDPVAVIVLFRRQFPMVRHTNNKRIPRQMVELQDSRWTKRTFGTSPLRSHEARAFLVEDIVSEDSAQW